MIDVHSHIIDTPEKLHEINELQTKKLLVMSTRTLDFSLVESLAAKYDKIIPAYGIHPWFTNSECNLDELEKYLLKYPAALVGEIGLDKVATDKDGNLYDFKKQLDLFQQQMDLAIKYRRPVSVHCVHTPSEMLNYFTVMDKTCAKFKKSNLALPCPPSIMMHSFTASLEIAKQLIKLPRIGKRFYFSFSHFVNARSPKSLEKINGIPDDRILIESDIHDTSMVDEAMEKIITLVASAKGWSVEETVNLTTQNTIEFLRG
ncbi:hypothetical protein HDV06_006771 [Boothiomyces sp. JEL0866]|nr:hypothetical protein HDV06_006771 [Boothiomyces sp. JEL0866]